MKCCSQYIHEAYVCMSWEYLSILATIVELYLICWISLHNTRYCLRSVSEECLECILRGVHSFSSMMSRIVRSWCHLIGSDSSILIDEKLHYQESFIVHTIGGLDRVADSFIFDFLRDHIRRNSRSNQYSIILEILRYSSDDNLPVLISEQYDGHLICEVYFLF